MRRGVDHLWPVVHYRPPLCAPVGQRDGTAVSQGHNGYRQIRSRTAERPLSDPMIRAMTDMPCHPPADGSSPVPGDRSVYPSAYTPVHTQKQEVS
jgi:hypothetical protein